VLAGGGDERPRLEQLTRDLGVSEHAYFLHDLRAEQVFACYANCDVFALPSRGEGFGLVFLEATAHAKPVICGAHGEIPGIVESGVTGPARDARRRGASRASPRISFRQSESGREMGARGLERVQKEYAFEEFQSRLNGIIDAVLRNS
jgi:glycosyltransferase involved in cell wall biosynthesis